MTAMQVLEQMDAKTQERIRNEYEALAKSSIKMGVNCDDPENWLAQHPEIAPKLYTTTNDRFHPIITPKFRAMMFEWGFGEIIERARWFTLGR